MIKGKKIAVVLGGGAACGFAHVGVLRALEENGIEPDIVVGTSMGAIVGGYYCAGASSADMDELVKRFKRVDIFEINLLIKNKSILNTNKIEKMLKEITQEKNIEDCSIVFRAVATDLLNGREVIIDKGPIWKAARASMAIPSIFPPFDIDGVELFDGGLLNNVPADIAYELGADYVIAVDVTQYHNLKKENNWILPSLYNTILLMQQEIVNLKTKCDCLIKPDLKGVSLERYDPAEIQLAVDIGYKEAISVIDKIKKDLKIK